MTVDAAVNVEITGIEGTLRENVQLFIGTPPDSAPLLVQRFARTATEKAQQALQALGHYEAIVQVSIERRGDDRIIRVKVNPGEPVRIASTDIVISGEASIDLAFDRLLSRLRLQTGEILHHGRYESAKRALDTLAQSRGYLDGRFAASQIRVRKAAREADIVLHYESGPRYLLGPVRLPQTPLYDRLLQRLVPFQPNEPYLADHIGALHANLLASGYFDDVRIRPLPEEADENLAIPVRVELRMTPRNQVGMGLGLTTDVGPRIRLEWKRPWVNSRGHSAVLRNELSWVRQHALVQYSIPLRPPLDHQLQFSAGWKGEQIEDTRSDTLQAGIQNRRMFRNGWQRTPFLRWEQERYTQADVQDTTTLTLPGLSLARTRRSGGVIPLRGDRLFATLETAHPDLFSDIRLTRVLLQAKRLDTWRAHSLLGRIEYGALDTSDFDRTPPSLRFFAGGDQSVRGFAYQSLAPRNEDNELLGGRYLLTGSLEYNLQFASKWKAALFYDIGNASTDSRFSEGFAQGTGFGIRWLSPLAPIKLDVAWGISEAPTPFRVHFAMGADL